MTIAGRISAPIWAVTRAIFGHEVPHWGVGAYSRESPPPDPVERIVDGKEELLRIVRNVQEHRRRPPPTPVYRPYPAAIQVVMDRPGSISLLAPNGIKVSVPGRLRTADQLHGWFYEHVVPSLSTDRGASLADLLDRLDRTHAVACRDNTQMF